MATTRQYEADERGLLDRILEEYGSAQGLLFLLPTLAILSVIIFWPLINYGILLSFKHYTISPNQVNPFVGLQNYMYWLAGAGTSLLVFSIKQTLLFGLVVLPLTLIMAMGAALVMNEEMPARPLFRGLILAGYAAPPVAAGIVWAIMEQGAVYGIIYQFLNQLPLISIPQSGGMTANTPWAFWAVVIPKMWRDFAFIYVVLLAGIQSVPSSLYEMAKVDGAGPVQRFRYITLPHLRTVLVTVILIRTVFTVGGMATTWAVTGGGPVNYTTFIAVLIFKRAFVSWTLGQAAALGILFALTVIPLIMLWVKLETEDYD